jgi:hypothetical protein
MENLSSTYESAKTEYINVNEVQIAYRTMDRFFNIRSCSIVKLSTFWIMKYNMNKRKEN